MAGVKKTKAKRLQSRAAAKSGRTVKGRNKTTKVSRTDKKKPTNSGRGSRRPTGRAPAQ